MKSVKLFLSAALVAIAAPVTAQQAPVTRTEGTATLENVPAIPADIAEAVQRYQNSRSAEFQAWQPDGSILITTRFGGTDQVHHVRAPGAARTQVSFYAEPVAGAYAIPGSEQFLVRRDTGGDEWFQIYVRGLTGKEERLTEPETRNSAPVLSDDGHLAVWAKAVRGTARYELMAADPLAPAAARSLLSVEGSIDPSDLSDDGSKLLFVRSFSNRQSEIWELDVASGDARRLTEEGAKARYDEPRYIRGGHILAISDHGGDYRRLLELDPATGDERAVTPELEWNVEAFDVSKDGRVLAYAVNEGGYSRVAVQDFLTRRALPQPDDLPKGVLTGLKWSPDGAKLAISLTTPTAAGDVYSFAVPAGELTRWTNSELGGLVPDEISEPTLISFETFDGRAIPAFVYRPAGIPEEQVTPVIMDIHGGPESQTRPGWNYGAQFFANALGATVILPNVRGSDGYGGTYLDLDNAEKREDSVRDIGALIDWIGTQPNMDADRIAVYGQSYGGYMSLAVMTHYSDRLVGGVERYGISNFITFLENTEDYRRSNRRGEYGDETDPDMRAVFERIAPMNNLQKISKPMLVMQGANDPRVPQSESDQVVAALRQNGVDTWYVLFADEGHGFHKKANNDLRREVEAVFLQDLFGGAPTN